MQVFPVFFNFEELKYISLKPAHNPFKIQGTRGCKNIRAGGDTVQWNGYASEGQFYMTYVVLRSFKYPPPVKKQL